jgi:hypothetical protein
MDMIWISFVMLSASFLASEQPASGVETVSPVLAAGDETV